jgi:hypothetical protein
MIFPARMAVSIFLYYTDSTYVEKVRSPSNPSMVFSAIGAESIFLYTDVTYLDKVRSPSHAP